MTLLQECKVSIEDVGGYSLQALTLQPASAHPAAHADV